MIALGGTPRDVRVRSAEEHEVDQRTHGALVRGLSVLGRLIWAACASFAAPRARVCVCVCVCVWARCECACAQTCR